MNYVEQELKFVANNLKLIAAKIANFGILQKNWHFEQNTLFDTSDFGYRAEQKIIRLRTVGQQSEFTLKSPLLNADFRTKHVQEFNMPIIDKDVFLAILEQLHLKSHQKYEKFRQEWLFENSIICLDILPFGEFVEIEGNSYEQIIGIAEKIGLDILTADTSSYRALFQIFCAENKLSNSNDILFSEKEKQKIIEIYFNEDSYV